MKAVILHEPGSPAGLRLVETDIPQLGPRDVLVKVKACGVCYHDVVVTMGLLRRGVKDRIILGHEIAGEVADVGPLVETVTRGQRVASILSEICGACPRCREGNEHRCLEGRGIGHGVDGGYAEFARITELSLRPIPDGIAFEEAAICTCPIGVALRALQDVAMVRSGETVLVTGASGGLGVHGLQIARMAGARVLAITGSPEKVERLRTLGADEVILSPAADFHWDVLALTEDRGVDVVLETVGSLTFEASFKSLGQYGRLVFVGEVAGKNIAVNPALMLFKDARLFGSAGAGRKHLDAALDLVRQKRIKPIVTPFPLREAARVHQMLLERKLIGRAVLIP